MAVLANVGSFAMLVIESQWVYTASGVLFAVGLWAVRKNEKLSWLSILGLPILGLCMTIFLAPASDRPHRFAWFMAGWGGLLVLDGAIALTRYLRTESSAKSGPAMTPDLKELRTLDRTIHEPARLMIITVLYAIAEADFLYLQRECGLT